LLKTTTLALTIYFSHRLSMSSLIDRYIGTQIKNFRLEAGESIETLSEKIGISAEKWQKYESGLVRIASNDLHLISKVLGEGPNKFFPDFALNHNHETDIGTLRQEVMKLVNGIDSREVLTLIANLLRPLNRR